jgi:hypothetical protein
MLKLLAPPLAAALTALALLAPLPAGAAINGSDPGDGSFSNLGYGLTGNAFVTPFLFVGDLAATDTPTSLLLGVANLTYSAAASGLGSSVVEVAYSFTNNSDSFTWTTLRFMLDVQADGNLSFSDVAAQSWEAPIAADPDKRQVSDFLANPLATQIVSNNGLIDAAPACNPCDFDGGLEWDLATLGPNQTWTINVKLVDDASLVLAGPGRYLSATSSEAAGTTLIFGNPQLVPEPETYALLLAGLGLLAFQRMRKT